MPIEVAADEQLRFLEDLQTWLRTTDTREPLVTSSPDVADHHRLAGLLPEVRSLDGLRARQRGLLARTTEISRGLRAAGVAHAVLRGGITAVACPTPLQRRFADIDLLVSFDDVTKVRAVLRASGFRQGTVDPAGARSATPAELARERNEKRLHAFIGDDLLDDGTHAIVEVHHRLRPPAEPGPPATETLLDRVVTEVLPGGAGEVPALAVLDRAVELCVHIESKATHLPALRSGRDLRLGLYLDLVLLMVRHDLTDEALGRRGHALGYGDSVRLAGAICREVTGQGPPVRVPIRYHVKGQGYRTVALLDQPIELRLRDGNSVPGLQWSLPATSFDEAAVLHPHGETDGHGA
jgi:hypothetical protein